jgi:rhomboid protease GluP
MGLVAAIALVFGLELALGATRSIRVLVDMGALVPSAVEDGQGWRLLTSIFLHANLFHLLVNAWSLYLFGSLAEGAFGTPRLAGIFLVTGFVASATSFAFGGQVSVGASGAIFGLLGAWVSHNWLRRNLSMAQGNLRLAALIVAVNLFFGFSMPGIDNAAHLGGLAAGLAAGFAAEGVGRRGVRTASRIAGLALVAAAGVLLVAMGPFG